MEDKKKNVLKAIFSGLVVVILLLITVIGCSKQAKAEEMETLDLTPVNTYDNYQDLKGTKWLIYRDHFNVIQNYATSSSVYSMFTVKYSTMYLWDWTSKTISMTKYGTDRPQYYYGFSYYPNALYLQTSLNSFETIAVTGTNALQWVVVDYTNINTTESNAKYFYYPRFSTLLKVAEDVTMLSDEQIKLMIATKEGYETGQQEIFNNPNRFDLYNQQQYDAYGQERYNVGLTVGSDGVAKSQTWFMGIFTGLSALFSIKIFGGSITLGMLCMIPFSIEFVFVIFKLIRGGD